MSAMQTFVDLSTQIKLMEKGDKRALGRILKILSKVNNIKTLFVDAMREIEVYHEPKSLSETVKVNGYDIEIHPYNQHAPLKVQVL